MRPARRSTDLRIWLALALVLHSCLFAVPSGIVEAIFPTRPEAQEGPPADLTPDFEDIAIRVMPLPHEETPASPEVALAEVTGPQAAPVPPQVDSGGQGPAQSNEGGGTGSPADTRFFPPVPRLVVPPDLGDTKVLTLSIELRILVGTDGLPLAIEVPDTLSDRHLREKILESAGRFRFEPARQGDLPVQAWVSLPLRLQASR
jgi:protein TonB